MTPESIAFVHDWMIVYAGSEKVLEAAAELFPGAPIFTLIHRPEVYVNRALGRHPVRTSFINRLPKAKERHRSYLPLMPFAIEQFDVSGYDVVFSSSHAVAKGVRTNPGQLHVCYVHSPVRYAWDLEHQYLAGRGGVRGALMRLVLHYIRLWDVTASNRVDVFVANSRFVAERIRKTYRRDAAIVHPPVDVDRFDPTRQREDFYLTVSRLVPYKRLDLIVAAFNRLGLPLVVIGDGPDLESLRRRAPNIKFLGHQPDDVVADHMERCKAFVFAAVEDFGISMVEAQAAGAGVIAYERGGVQDSIIHGETGYLYRDQTPGSLVNAVEAFERGDFTFDPEKNRKNAERFGRERFQAEILELIEREAARVRR